MEPAGTERHGRPGRRPSERERASQTPYNSQRRLIAQFHVPVREINEVFPQIVLRRSKSDLDKRPPLWPLRFADQTHVRFAREPITLARIASDARANNVFPCGHASAVAWHDVIQIKVAPVENLAAILAGVLVALEHVVTRELYLFLWKPIEH